MSSFFIVAGISGYPHYRQKQSHRNLYYDDCDDFIPDVSPPDLTCPADIEVEALEGINIAEVEWEVPVPVDNSRVTVSLSVVPALVPPTNLPIGKTRITYTATDSNKNSISCSFKILVKGNLR